MWQAELGLTHTKWLRSRFTYYRMGAYHAFPGSPSGYGEGTRRGDQFQVRGDFRFGKRWEGHALYELMAPGDFYARPDKAWFLRFELIFRLQGSHEL
jgi:hypothetical protein